VIRTKDHMLTVGRDTNRGPLRAGV